MGIKFTCPACGGALNVKSELAGKRGRCPKCQAKITIPAEGASAGSDSEEGGQSAAAPVAGASAFAANPPPAEGAARLSAEEQSAAPQPTVAVAAAGAVDAISEAPTLHWYAAPPGATSQYGPASGEEFRAWMQEGRITADALVWRQDWADWQRAGNVFPQLETPTAAGAPPIAPHGPATATPLPTAAAAMPMAAGGPPVARPAFPMAGAMPGVVPTAAPVASDAFPITAEEPAAKRGSVARGRGYRQRSNTGPVIAIVVLLVAMIPLSYFVWKVVSEQLGATPAAVESD
jgi:hypothetical protein